MRIVVIGKSGQVARALARASPDVVALGRAELDLNDPDSLRVVLADADAVINAAAYSAVDKAESERDAAFALNAEAPALLAQLCAEARLPLVHLSTDYVFDGAKASPYVEDDPVAPINVYGESKAAGERAVLESGARAIVLRTSAVYAAEGANFVNTMLRLGAERDALTVVADQLTRPTWADDLAGACLKLAQALRDAGAPTGLFHATNDGEASWAEFAEAIFDEARRRGWPHARVTRIPSADYPTAARRPANARLDTEKLARAYDIRLRPWRAALALCLDARTP